MARNLVQHRQYEGTHAPGRAWTDRVPTEFHRSVLGEADPTSRILIEDDPYCIATLKHFASLVPIAQTARTPMFDLRQADGIGGGQTLSVKCCKEELERLVTEIQTRLADASCIGRIHGMADHADARRGTAY